MNGPTSKLVVAVLCSYVVGSAWPSQAARASDEQARQVITQFISEEFAGELDVRQRLATFSPKREESIEARLHPDYLTGLVISLSGSPMVIVNKYEIGSVTLEGNRAIASVAFDQVARTEGRGLPGRKLYVAPKPNEIVQYELRRTKGKWHVFDPPLPRVSKAALLAHYEGAVQSMERVVTDPRASRAQKKVYEALKKDLDSIRAL
jgi:hypothetical protein